MMGESVSRKMKEEKITQTADQRANSKKHGKESKSSWGQSEKGQHFSRVLDQDNRDCAGETVVKTEKQRKQMNYKGVIIILTADFSPHGC